ncbi:glycogen debranching protein GlgX [Sediminispirochaeta smaragdinae]|uniref:Glycogen debranching enzyme GlgX n=1 Tax=Sediminispirochaeta smaragdinae (strain DSM 11293 / JCM 15392 / SEBR 4228) TaxID=573413 RepID=E1R2J3_SEDSS|nr:glycogen debranching protein GlgX [Sediminispirochaeta smaragdinae]ADK82553.1 glycogen debranching enzyme GlgX [Sediminispirochaeta smaragdinae DSM 11293]
MELSTDKKQRTIEPGHPLPLGAYITGRGAQFSIFSRNATAVCLLLFDKANDTNPSETYQLDPKQNKTGDIWHIHIHGLKTGQFYLFQIDGPFEPAAGHRFDPAALIIDPYAKAIAQERPWVEWRRELTPKCVVVNDYFDWQGDKPLNYPLRDCIIYEAHVGGLTRHRSASSAAPGSYKAVIEKIPYFKELGITSIEFLPVHEFNPREFSRYNPVNGALLTNYWGYSTVGFFAPACGYSSSGCEGDQVHEFKEMVRELHKAGIEVVLDIVFNHTAEGNNEGPTFSFRGLDNSIYYILTPDRKGYMNYSGCGNTMNCNHPIVRSLILDCLHYWVMEMHVDGFRFDLGSILGRDGSGKLLENPPIIERIAEDPVLRDTKIIAEAWDAAGTYQVGSFPGGRWAEWNDRFRDDVRRFWLDEPGMIAALAMRFSGSSDLYRKTGRKPFHSINFITSHDGFTLNDLVSYNTKHNEMNGEENRDGNNANLSFNHGIEGPSDDPKIESDRNRTAKNFLATLLLATGTPMLLGGDEFRRTQQGNNNAYCQDNEISWFDWELLQRHGDVFRFCKELIKFRRRHPAFKRFDFFSGKDISSNGLMDISWYNERCKAVNWNRKENRLAILIDGSKAETQADKDDNDFYLMFNATGEDTHFTLAPPPSCKIWRRKIDTAEDVDILEMGTSLLLSDQGSYMVKARSVVVLVSDPTE